MTVELKPETERLVLEEIRSGHVVSADELIVFGVNAVREKTQTTQPPRPPSRKKLYDLLTQSPFAGSGLELERVRENPRILDLGADDL